MTSTWSPATTPTPCRSSWATRPRGSSRPWGRGSQQRVLTGTSFGGGHQRTDVPLLLDLFMAGQYRLRELVSRRLPLTELNLAFELMRRGEVKRSVIVYE